MAREEEQLTLFDVANRTDPRAVIPINDESADAAACTRVQAPPGDPGRTPDPAASPVSSAGLPITPIIPHSDPSEPPHGPPAFTLTTPWTEAVEAFLQSALDCPHTERAYRRHLHQAFRWLKVETVADLTGAQLAAYRAIVMATSLAPASQALALAALRSFLRWAAAMGTHTLAGEAIGVALRSPKADLRRPYVVLSDPEIGNVLSITTTARDRALLATLLGAGLRVAEAVALDVRDVIEDVDGGIVLSVHPREVFKPAILANAASLILVHGHPSGDPEPSAEDKAITDRLRQAGELMGIKILDHVVIGDGRYASFSERQMV